MVKPLPEMADWYERNVAAYEREQRAANEAERRARRRDLENKPATDWTEEDRQMLAALSGVTYPVGCFHKRFARDIGHYHQLTSRQRVTLRGMVWRYRRQVRDADAVAKARAFLESIAVRDPSEGNP